MRRAHYTVTSQEVQDYAAGLLLKHLGIADFSTKCTAIILLQVAFAAAARLTSLYAAWRAFGQGTFGRDGAQGAVDNAAGLCRVATPRQSSLGGRLAQGFDKAQTTLGYRSAFGALLRRPLRGPQGDLPLASQGWHQQLSRLRQRLRRVPRPTVHGGPDAGRAGREDEAGGPAAPRPGTPCRSATTAFAAGSRVLQRRGDSLPAAGAGALPDARRGPGSPARSRQTCDRDPRFSVVEAGWLGTPSADVGQDFRDGRDRRALPQLSRPMEEARTPCLGLCLLGIPAGIDRLDSGRLSATFRHRNQLSATERSQNQDMYPSTRGAVFLDRVGVDPAQRLGVAALADPVESCAVVVGYSVSNAYASRRCCCGCCMRPKLPSACSTKRPRNARRSLGMQRARAEECFLELLNLGSALLFQHSGYPGDRCSRLRRCGT